MSFLFCKYLEFGSLDVISVIPFSNLDPGIWAPAARRVRKRGDETAPKSQETEFLVVLAEFKRLYGFNVINRVRYSPGCRV